MLIICYNNILDGPKLITYIFKLMSLFSFYFFNMAMGNLKYVCGSCDIFNGQQFPRRMVLKFKYTSEFLGSHIKLIQCLN